MRSFVSRLIERYYIWRAERRTESLGAGGSLDTVPLSEDERTIRQLADIESTSAMLFRFGGVYFGVFAIVAGIVRVLSRLLPEAAYSLFGLAILLLLLWTYLSMDMFLKNLRVRKELREKRDASNQAMQRTATGLGSALQKL